jgi:hypothetical protein
MRDLLSFPNRFFEGLDFQRKSGIVFLICACELWLVSPKYEMWLEACVLGISSATCLMKTSSKQPETKELTQKN